MANEKYNSYKYKDWNCFVIFRVFYLVGGRWVDGGPIGDSGVGGSVDDLSVDRWLVVGELVEEVSVVGGEPVGGSVVGGRWFCNTPNKNYRLKKCGLFLL